MDLQTKIEYSEDDIRLLCELCYRLNARWWADPKTEQPIERNIGEMLMLVVNEIAGAMEGHRKNLQDNHLPEFLSIEVELADALIRIFDLAGGLNLRLGPAFAAKLKYNQERYTSYLKLTKANLEILVPNRSYLT